MKNLLSKMTIYNISILALIFIIAWQVYEVSIYFPVYNTNTFIAKHINEPTIVISPTNTPTYTPTPTPPTWALNYINGSNTKTILTVDTDTLKSMTKWNDYVFYADTKVKEIKKINLQNQEVTTVLKIRDTGIKSIYPEDKDGASFGGFELVDNKLFFRVTAQGQYFTLAGALYGMNSPIDTPHKIIDIPGQIIKEGNNNLIRISDGGDVCGGRLVYAFLNVDTLTAYKIVETSEGCVKGEHFVAFDALNRILVAYQNQTSYGGFFFSKTGTFEYVIAIPILHPEIREGIIAKQDMPPGIIGIQYDKKRDELILLGPSFYTMKLSEHTPRKIFNLPIDWKETWIEKPNEDTLCIFYPYADIKSNTETVTGMEVDLNTLEHTTNTTLCAKSMYVERSDKPPTPIPTESIELIINKLQLPAGYDLVKNN